MSSLAAAQPKHARSVTNPVQEYAPPTGVALTKVMAGG